MSVSIPVCIDLPDATALRYRYALDELLRGLGLTASPARRDDAQIIVSAEPCVASSRLCFQVDPEAVCTSRRVELADLAWLEVEGEKWPLPVGPRGKPAAGPSGVIDADVLGSAFWWLAGVQEASTVERDRHGRFPYARLCNSSWRTHMDRLRLERRCVLQ